MNESLRPCSTRTAIGFTIASVLLSVEACGSGPVPDTLDSTVRTVDVSRHVSDCHEPCSLPLYKQPKASEYLTNLQPDKQGKPSIDPNGTLGYVQLFTSEPGHDTPWPSQGETLTVVCQLKGERIQDKPVNSDTAGRASDIWDVIPVPLDKLNSVTRTEAESENPAFGVQKDATGKVIGMYAMAADIWLGNTGLGQHLPACSTVINPQQY